MAINKTIDNGVIRINEASFLEFSNAFRGYVICSRKNGAVVPKFIAFWKGFTVIDVKKNFELKRRGSDY